MTPLFVVSVSCRFFWFILRLLCCCSVLGGRSYGSRGFAQTQCLSPSCTVSAYYTTRWPSCSSLPWRSTLTDFTVLFLTLDILRLLVLVFFGSFAFGVIPGACSPGVPPRREFSVFSRITRSSLCVSVPLFSLQFLLEEASPQLQSSRSSISCDGTEAYSPLLRYCVRRPLFFPGGLQSWTR